MRARVLTCLTLFLLNLLPPLAWAGKQTVCTITINSDDEQKVFRRHLTPDKYDFVELVERGRPDWLASSCQQRVSCDILVISGHHGEGGEGNVFFSEANDAREYLPIEELERVSCSGACPGLFTNLKEVYLFGCNTLNSAPQHTVSGEIARSLVREGHSPTSAAQLARTLEKRRGESSRDRMQLVFPSVPVIYGFSSVAPLGKFAASKLDRYFRSAGTSEVGSGRPSSRLLREFSANRMVATRGTSAADPLTATRRDVCMFTDDRMPDAQRVAGIHELLRRNTAEGRMMLGRIEAFNATLDEDTRRRPDVAEALRRIAQDVDARDRFLVFARTGDELDTRARMFRVAQQLGWLTEAQRRDELVRMTGELLARKDIAATDVNLVCALNEQRELDGALARLAPQAASPDAPGHAAVLACMGSDEARAPVLKALVGPSDADVQIAQTYLRSRPIADPAELRNVTRDIAAMSSPEAQARALDVLARHYLSDPQSVALLKTLYAGTRSPQVQIAIAGVLIRADRKSIADPELLHTLRDRRLKSSGGDTVLDGLIERLRESS